jgi:hypothetical protein
MHFDIASFSNGNIILSGFLFCGTPMEVVALVISVSTLLLWILPLQFTSPSGLVKKNAHPKEQK